MRAGTLLGSRDVAQRRHPKYQRASRATQSRYGSGLHRKPGVLRMNDEVYKHIVWSDRHASKSL